MKKRETAFSYIEYSGSDQLPAADRALAEEALEAAAGAYAPYSGFRVGAAIRLDDGTVIRGANVENAAFPSGSCAEKTALSYMVANHGNRRAEAIAITAIHHGEMSDEPVTPCGNCRQMLAEEERRTNTPIKVILAGRSKVWVIEESSQLLPLSFTGGSMK